MQYKPHPGHAITGYFVLILAVSLTGRILGGGGFGMTALLNAAQAFSVFLFLAVCTLSWLTQQPRIPLTVHRDVLPHVMLLMFMIIAGFLIGAISGNVKIYLLSTTLYWLNYLLFTIYVSSVDCSRTDFLRFGKWIVVAVIISALLRGGVDSAIANLMACLFVIFAFGERRIGWALLCLAPFALRLSSLNRSFLLALLTATIIGALLYRRSMVVSSIIVALILIIITFATIDVALIAEPGTGLYRRLNEIQVLMNGTQKLEDIVALQQRIFEIRLVNQEMNDAGPLGRILGAGFGKTLDMSATQDESVIRATSTGAAHVHNVHSLPHSIYLRSGYMGLLFLGLILFSSLRNALRAMMAPRVSPLLAFCLLFPFCTIVSALPAANYFLTEFILLALIAQASILLEKEALETSASESAAHAVQKSYMRRRRRIVW